MRDAALLPIPPVPAQDTSRKRARDSLPLTAWVELVTKYKNGKYKSTAQFLRTEGINVRKYKDAFCRRLKQHEAGMIVPAAIADSKRLRKSKFPDVEEKLAEYIRLRRQLMQRDKVGLSFSILQAKAKFFATKLGHAEPFDASPGWISKVLKRSDLVSVHLQGEAGEYSAEEREEAMAGFKTSISRLMEKYAITPDRIYNADQTGLFYQKLPNTMYVNKTERATARGTKQMRDKTRVTLMVCTSASGAKVPLHIVGKHKQPACFRLQPDRKPPVYYTHQDKAWYDGPTTVRWISELFATHVRKVHGSDVHVILLLDNCPAHKVNLQGVNGKYIHIVFFPPNLTCWHQPADMGIIQSLKTGYKGNLLETLLQICDDPVLYQQAITLGAAAKRGQKGLMHASKPHLIDAMLILLKVWNRADRYCTEDGIKRCWLRANCLPTAMQSQIQAEVEPGKNRIAQYRLPDNELNALCSSMLALRASVDRLNDVPPAIDESYSDGRDTAVTQSQLQDMMELWTSIEDQPEVVNQELEEAIEDLLTIDDSHDTNEDMDLDDDESAATNPSSMPDTASSISAETDSTSLSSEEMFNFVNLLEKVRKDSTLSKESRYLAYSLETQLHADRLKRRARQTSLRSYFDTR